MLMQSQFPQMVNLIIIGYHYFPVVFILKNSTTKSFRQEYNLENYEYFLSHLQDIYENLDIVSQK